MKVFTVLFIIYLYFNQALAQDGHLFQSVEPLELILEADVIALTDDKSENPEYTSAFLIQNLPNHKINGFEIKVKPRGNSRRLTDLCDFPPLKLNFKKNHVANTVFEGQDKLKFVSQCRQQDEFKNYVLEEYLLYKTYNIITEESYKVRLVNITIKDKKSRLPAFQISGFLIEDEKSLAKRIGAKSFEKHIYSQDSCTEASVDRFATFQFMIGNTDWYIISKHNTDIFRYKHDESIIPFPFDFDCAGVINAIYAKPSIEIPITQVRQRYFKGSCRDLNAFNTTFNLFNEKQDEIYTLYSTFEYLPNYVIKKSLKYYNKFYNIIDNPELINESFYNVCKPGPFDIHLIN